MLFVVDDPLRVTFELQHIEPGIGAIDDVDIAAIIGCDIVRLDHPAAHIRIALIRTAAEIRILGDGRN